MCPGVRHTTADRHPEESAVATREKRTRQPSTSDGHLQEYVQG